MSAEIAALQNALAAEHAVIYGYGVAGAMLTGASQADAVADWTAHLTARDNLESRLTGLGATPVAASPAYQLPFAVTNAATAARLAAVLEDGLTRAYLGVVAAHGPCRPRRTVRSPGAVRLPRSRECLVNPGRGRVSRWRGAVLARG